MAKDRTKKNPQKSEERNILTVMEALEKILIIAYPVEEKEIYRTIAGEIINNFCSDAVVFDLKSSKLLPKLPALKMSIDNKKYSKKTPVKENPNYQQWMTFRIDESGNFELKVSDTHLLYPLFCMIKEDWAEKNISEFKNGKTIQPGFVWMRNLSDFFVGSLRYARHFNREDYIKQLARQGFSHVTINGLGVDRAFESGPPGDIYSWFYDYSPDLDQFVPSKLLKGYYPPDYLQTNLNFLKNNARLAIKYGLTPGLHINSPRSMPEEFWNRYGFLRGARIDHPRESFRPRYTLAMAHPIVQDHYHELIKNVMAEVPEIGFIHIWTNDSGSGFEFVTSLYAGRNGGPYLIREWKGEDEIAKKAAENVLTYYKILNEEAKSVNPDFHLVCDLGPFYVERKYIVPELGHGIDAGSFGSFESVETKEEETNLKKLGALTHYKVDVCDNNVLGIPYPKLTYERLKFVAEKDRKWILTGATPISLSPFDINMEVLRFFQLQPDKKIDLILKEKADEWGGSEFSTILIEIWDLVDSAVRSYPDNIPYSTFAFPWFRLWVRPFVPNIDAIPEKERRYYEDFLLATFNNPNRIDFNNDMMWNFLTIKEAGEKKHQIDTLVLPKLEAAIFKITDVVQPATLLGPEEVVFTDLLDRLTAAACFYTTMRNMAAWIESVHGYMKSKSGKDKEKYRSLVQDLIDKELKNAQKLLSLWETSTTDFIPISAKGETLHLYGENFDELLKLKIDIMNRYRYEEPHIDPDYMWRMPRII